MDLKDFLELIKTYGLGGVAVTVGVGAGLLLGVDGRKTARALAPRVQVVAPLALLATVAQLALKRVARTHGLAAVERGLTAAIARGDADDATHGRGSGELCGARVDAGDRDGLFKPFPLAEECRLVC